MSQTILHTGTYDVNPPHLSKCVVEAITMLAEQPLLRSRARFIRVELIDGHLVLHGNLPSFFLKQIAQETLRSIGLPISNRICIQA